MNSNIDIANALALTQSFDLIPVHLTKARIVDRSKAIVADLAEENDPAKIVETVELVAAMDLLQKKMREDARFVDMVRTELAKNGGRITTASGAVIEAVESGVQYDYSVDGEWCRLNEEIEYLTEKRKDREEKMRAIKEGKIWVDESSGEMIQGANKVSKSTYRITLKK